MFVICESEAWKLEPLLQTLYDGYLNNLQLVTNQELKYQKLDLFDGCPTPPNWIE